MLRTISTLLAYLGLLGWVVLPWALAEGLAARRERRTRERRAAEREALAEWRAEAARSALLSAVRLVRLAGRLSGER